MVMYKVVVTTSTNHTQTMDYSTLGRSPVVPIMTTNSMAALSTDRLHTRKRDCSPGY